MRVQRLILILAIVVALVGAVVGYYVWHNAHPAAPKPHEVSVGVESNTAITRATELAQQQKYAEAIAALEAVRTKTPYDQDKVDLGIAESSIYLQAKDAVSARDVLLDVTKIKSDSLAAQFNLGIAAQRIVDYGTALTAFNQAQKLLTDKDAVTIKARITSSLAAIPGQQAQLKSYDTELVRLMGRYVWYELFDNPAAANTQYQPVTKFIAANNINSDTVTALHQKLQQTIIANLSSPN